LPLEVPLDVFEPLFSGGSFVLRRLKMLALQLVGAK
jgi:hypothetical protein